MVKRQQFTAEFKLEAVRQMHSGNKPITQLSRELGIPRNRLYKLEWPAFYRHLRMGTIPEVSNGETTVYCGVQA